MLQIPSVAKVLEKRALDAIAPQKEFLARADASFPKFVSCRCVLSKAATIAFGGQSSFSLSVQRA
jgi:hypothetical protein